MLGCGYTDRFLTADEIRETVRAGLASLSKHVIQVLDEQSTGLLAENIEKTLVQNGQPAPTGRERKQGVAA